VQPNLQLLYNQAHTDFLQGNLDLALRETQTPIIPDTTDPAWPQQFQLLQAEVLTYKGMRPAVLTLLDCADPTFAAPPNLLIKRELLCGLAHGGLGQTEQAARELQQARQLSAANNELLEGEVLQAEARIQLAANHLDEATDLYDQSLQAARRDHDAFLEASELSNLGNIALSQQHYDQALAFSTQASQVAAPIQARFILNTAMGNAGVAYFRLGDYDRALASFEQAEQQAGKLGATIVQIKWLLDQGATHYQRGRYDQAAACYRQSLKTAQSIGDLDAIANINTQLGFVLYQQQKYEAAGSDAEQALQAARKLGDSSIETRAQYLQALIATKQSGLASEASAEKMLLEVVQRSASFPAQQAEAESDLAKEYARRHRDREAERWFQKSIAIYEKDRSQIASDELKMPFFFNGIGLYLDYADFLIAGGRSARALHLLDQGRARTLAEGLGQSPSIAGSAILNEQAVARKLNATILFYSLNSNQSYLWVVNARHTALYPVPGEKEIAPHIRSYNESLLKSEDPLATRNADARYLYETLIQPAQLPSGAKVFIIPDGSLNTLNFETLLVPGPQGVHYWIEDATVTNAASIYLLSRHDPAANPKQLRLLLMGDPVLKNSQYENLPNAPGEITNIEKHFPAADRVALTQAQATPTAYTDSRPAQFSYIHFVTHGTASERSPLDSAVVLSASPRNPEDFKLYARDIVRCPLHARLVTISACYGSGLTAYAGEGLVGLSWAFLRAGAHNVIGALWEANDASTPLLMDRLYTEIAAGRAPEAALREAKLSLIHTTGVYRKPFYWAAFQLYAGS
jgi:CHAT domain-containing protein